MDRYTKWGLNIQYHVIRQAPGCKGNKDFPPSVTRPSRLRSCLRRGASSISQKPQWLTSLPIRRGQPGSALAGGHAQGRRTGHNPRGRPQPGASFSAPGFTPTNTDKLRGSWEQGSKPTWSAEPQGSRRGSRLATQLRTRAALFRWPPPERPAGRRLRVPGRRAHLAPPAAP